MALSTVSPVVEDLEAKLIERINSFYLLPRKSSEVLDAQGKIPLALTEEVRQIADLFLRGASIDPTGQDDATGWNIFWAREMAAAMSAIPNRGGMYQTYLPGRFMHYDLLAQDISLLFNDGGNGIKGKSVVEIGSGSGLGLMKLAERGAIVTGLDSSIMAIQFARYLARHYNISDRVTLVQGDYSNIPPEIKDGQFDVVYNSGVVEHVINPEGLIKQMAGITKPGGYVVIAIPNEEGIFYQRFKRKENDTKERYPSLIRIPVEHERYHPDIPQLMEDSGLVVVRQDGLQIAPSAPIEKGDIIQNDLRIFESYLPERQKLPRVEDIVNAWTVLELYASSALRIKYGWSLYYVGQKPVSYDIKPMVK